MRKKDSIETRQEQNQKKKKERMGNEMEQSPLHNDPGYREMLWYMKHSTLIRYSVLEWGMVQA